jgi:hypothetical protein
LSAARSLPPIDAEAATRWLRQQGLDQDERPGVAKVKHELRPSEKRAKEDCFDALAECEIGILAAERLLGVEESTVRGWRDNVKKHPRWSAIYDLPELGRVFVIKRLIGTLSDEAKGALVRFIIRAGDK